MVTDSSLARRFEWKYCITPEQTAELAETFELQAQRDAYCMGPEGTYHVRSLYYDTPDLRFYHESKERLKIRRKLRVRNYGAQEFFLEIKRKIESQVVKERVRIPGHQVAGALNGADPRTLMEGRSESDLRTLERFRQNVKTLGLVPTLQITYTRRAWIGRTDPNLRITLDRELRGRTQPGSDALFEEGMLFDFEPRHVLELKFVNRPPRWLLDVVTGGHLKRTRFSKYCEGIDRCRGGIDALEA